jgi:murein DD-endopeptidase MepM/ murein hydrolase activator NlpD
MRSKSTVFPSLTAFFAIGLTAFSFAVALTASSAAVASTLSKKPETTKGKIAESRAHYNPANEPAISAEQRIKAIKELRSKNLALPIAGFNIASVKGSFYETHGGVQHGAADMLAPRNTPVLAVENGTIAKLFNSKRGGLTIYQSDPTGKYIYYYAHLEKYANNLHDGDSIKKSQTIGFVGTSGNAPPNTPHLHFSIGIQDIPKKWWVTSSLDPYEVYAKSGT